MSDVHQRVKASTHEASIFNVLFTGFTDFVAYCYWPVALTAWALLAFLMIRSLIKDPPYQTTPDGPVGRASSIGCAGIFMAVPALGWPAFAYIGLMMVPFIVLAYAVIGVWSLIGKMSPSASESPPTAPPKERKPFFQRAVSRLRRNASRDEHVISSAPEKYVLSGSPPAADPSPATIMANTVVTISQSQLVAETPSRPSASTTWDKPMRVIWPESKPASVGVIPQLPPSATVAREISPVQMMSLNHRIMQAELYEMIVAATRSTLGAIVECEVGGVDIRVWTPEQTIYIELKTEGPARIAIRLALGQLLEYTWNDRESQSHRKSLLLIIGPDECNTETVAYLADLKERYRLPLKYVAYELGSRQFSWDAAIR